MPAGALAAEEAAAEPPTPPAPDGVPFALGLSAGYAFRLHEDGRSHGGAAELYGDVPIWGPFGARVSALGLGFGGSAAAERGLGVGGLALTGLYALDETEAVALFEAGPLLALSTELGAGAEPPALAPGVLLGIGVRFPISEVFRVEAAVRLPYVMSGGDASELSLQVMATVGLVIAPGALLDAALEGRDPLSALLPSG